MYCYVAYATHEVYIVCYTCVYMLLCDTIYAVQVGIHPEDVTAEVLPSHKKNQVEMLQKGKTKVCNSIMS